MIFSSEVLKQNSLIEKPNIIISEDSSLFTFGLEVLRESNDNIRGIIQNIYIESGYNINEGFMEEFTKKFNFKTIIKSIVKFFIDAIKDIFRQFKAIIIKIIYDSNTVEKYKDEILSYKEEIKYKKDFFRYSHLTAVVPSIDDFFNFFENYEDILDEMRDICKSKDKGIVLDNLKTKKNELKQSLGQFYDSVRKNMFSRFSKEIPYTTESNFASVCFKFFRSGNSTPLTSVTLNKDDYKESLNRFLNGKGLISDIEKEMKYIENKSSTEIKKIDKLMPEHVMKEYIPIDYELEYHFNDYLKVKCGQLQQICTIYTTVYSAKLEAVKSALIQDKKILFEVINEIVIKKGGV